MRYSRIGRFLRVGSPRRSIIKVSFKKKQLAQECSVDGKCEHLALELLNIYCACASC